ncbi:hypothetical protein L1049_004018 [Liquidambar formosana]|uniref:Beta-glucosidase n=1 Tax=Liquidambar formosana TaxID=63359 RepID=A0AAP0WZW9_LIQFO
MTSHLILFLALGPLLIRLRAQQTKMEGLLAFGTPLLMLEKQHGFIGINLYASWFVPLTNTKKDAIATQRAYDFYIGWFVEPLLFGDYPNTMKENAGSRIPAFTSDESKQVKGSFDFLGVNHYYSSYIKDNSSSLKMDQRDYGGDMAVEQIFMHDHPQHSPSPPNAEMPTFEFPNKPEGLQGVLEYFKQAYGNPPIYIHENGLSLSLSLSRLYLLAGCGIIFLVNLNTACLARSTYTTHCIIERHFEGGIYA